MFPHLHIFQAVSVALLDAMETPGFLDGVLRMIFGCQFPLWLVRRHAWSIEALEVNLILGPVRLFGSRSHRVRRVSALIRLDFTVVTTSEPWNIIVAWARYIMIHWDGLNGV